MLRLGRLSLLPLLGLAGPALAQSSLPLERVGRLNTDVAYSLFLLSNGTFSSLGTFKYSDPETTAKLGVYRLPLSLRFDGGPLGPLVLRLEAGFGEATTFSRRNAGLPEAVTQDREYVSLWLYRMRLGRPFELTPNLVLTPSVGIGGQRWTGKVNATGPGSAPPARLDFWATSLLLSAEAVLEYRQPLGALNLRPGFSVSHENLVNTGGRASLRVSSVPVGRGPASVEAQSTTFRAGLSLDGPLGLSLGATPLRWETFLIGNYSAANVGLFRWTIEVGAAVGADLGPLGRSVLGINPGQVFLGVSYIAGDNLSGVRANFGFAF